MRVHKGGLHVKGGQRVRQQVGGAAVDGFLRDDMPAVLRQRLNGVGDGSGAGRNRQCRHAAFQCGDALFKDILGGVGQATVDVAPCLQSKAIGSVLRVGENIGSGLVNGNSAGVGGGVGLLLADMKLQGFKMQFAVTHDNILISLTD